MKISHKHQMKMISTMGAFMTMRRYFKRFISDSIRLIPIVISILTIFVLFTLSNLVFLKSENRVKIHNNQCRDWHDYKQMFEDMTRTGPGEHGEPLKLTNETEIKLNEKFIKETGIGAVISDKISLNRSVPDTRPPECLKVLYPADLPKTSVIIIFYNEVLSVLLRTIHAVVNRTPPELLHEIILVNDCSTNQDLYQPLKEYVENNFESTKIRIKNLKERKGLIVTRLEGAEIATGEVLVFFDSHIEVNINWLPPLLTPIKVNRRVVTNPVVDNFNAETFQIGAWQKYGDRGAIDFDLIWHQIPRKLNEIKEPHKPFASPIMLGCAFAIDRKFFMEELDGYDREYKIWNGENYELSFKAWLCADGLYEVPCSHIVHTFRGHNPSRANIKEDFVGRNFKRLIEVWFDDYKDIVYSRDPERFAKIDAGDLTRPKAVRERLQCKNFNYFLKHVASDVIMRYPIEKLTPIFAAGQIKTLSNPEMCLDLLNRRSNEKIGLYKCHEVNDYKKTPHNQHFRLNFNKNIVISFSNHCLDSYNLDTPECTFAEYGNQYWKYDHINNMLINYGDNGQNCLAGNTTEKSISMKRCDVNDFDQKWMFTYENDTALNDWKNIYSYQKFYFGDNKIDLNIQGVDFYDGCSKML